MAGFGLASKWHVDRSLLLALISGLSLVIASACVFNNYIDRDLDKKMARTKERALASGKVSIGNAVIFATILSVAGFWTLSYTNWLTLLIIAIGFFGYVLVYGLTKRRTVHSTLIGTVPGAASLVAGYTAVTNRLDLAALILFLIMLSWQMVHFYAIAIFRVKDYKAANIPVMPIKTTVRFTKIQMLLYLTIFIIATILLTLAGYTGYIYLAVVILLGLIWLRRLLVGFKTHDSEVWARGVFKYSLVVLMVTAGAIALGAVLP